MKKCTITYSHYHTENMISSHFVSESNADDAHWFQFLSEILISCLWICPTLELMSCYWAVALHGYGKMSKCSVVFIAFEKIYRLIH